MLPIGSEDTGFSDFYNRRRCCVHNVNIVLVTDFVKVLLQGRTLRPERMRGFERGKKISFGGIGDTSASLLRPKVVSETIGGIIKKQVLEIGDPKFKSSLLP